MRLIVRPGQVCISLSKNADSHVLARLEKHESQKGVIVKDKLYNTGVIHGRFQILHNDHLSYLLSGMALCNHLIVGITNPAPAQTKPEKSDGNRGQSKANPLTYYERYTLVKTVLTSEGLSYRDFSIVPFPINFPERY